MKISEHFGLGVTQPSLDFVDTHTERDVALFVDPFAVSLRSDAWSLQCLEHIQNFFQRALELIHAGDELAAKRVLSGLREPKETGLGYGTKPRRGRGIGGDKAIDLYGALAKSNAAATGLLSDLGEFDLFVEGIGPDGLSDITTNVIKAPLIEYTQNQCLLWGIPLRAEVAVERIWDIATHSWISGYRQLPALGNAPLILVPKFTARRSLTLNSQEFYSDFVLDYLEGVELSRGSGLVRVLKNGSSKIFKKDLKEKYRFSKDFLARFSTSTPEVLQRYKDFYRNLPGGIGALTNADILDKFHEFFDEVAFSQALEREFESIAAGHKCANLYHKFIVGVLEFLFYPHLIYPTLEQEIHDGRKRIDIQYTNAAASGIFHQMRGLPQASSFFVPVECKNYAADPANPELDQLSGRFSRERGKFGILCCRSFSDRKLFVDRCRDTARDGRGIILPLSDVEICRMLQSIALGRRNAVDVYLNDLLKEVLS